jgi:hypothetical protein
LKPDRPQHDHPADCVVAQQYSSATYVSLRLHCRKAKFVARFRNIVCSISLLFKKSRNLKLGNGMLAAATS